MEFRFRAKSGNKTWRTVICIYAFGTRARTPILQYALAAGNCKNTIPLLQYMKRFGLEKTGRTYQCAKPFLSSLVLPATAVVEALTRAGVGPA